MMGSHDYRTVDVSTQLKLFEQEISNTHVSSTEDNRASIMTIRKNTVLRKAGLFEEHAATLDDHILNKLPHRAKKKMLTPSSVEKLSHRPLPPPKPILTNVSKSPDYSNSANSELRQYKLEPSFSKTILSATSPSKITNNLQHSKDISCTKSTYSTSLSNNFTQSTNFSTHSSFINSNSHANVSDSHPVCEVSSVSSRLNPSPHFRALRPPSRTRTYSSELIDESEIIDDKTDRSVFMQDPSSLAVSSSQFTTSIPNSAPQHVSSIYQNLSDSSSTDIISTDVTATSGGTPIYINPTANNKHLMTYFLTHKTDSAKPKPKVPAKPPRTFAHDIYRLNRRANTDQDSCNTIGCTNISDSVSVNKVLTDLYRNTDNEKNRVLNEQCSKFSNSSESPFSSQQKTEDFSYKSEPVLRRFNSLPDDDTIYSDPAIFVGSKTADEVMFDELGYALPSVMCKAAKRSSLKSDNRQSGNNSDRQFKRRSMRLFTKNKAKKNPEVQRQISRAYSVLRLNEEVLSCTEESNPVQEDTESLVDLDEHNRRLDYVRNVRKSTKYGSASSKKHLLLSHTKLFEYALIVGIKKSSLDSNYKPHVIYQFPNDIKVQQNMSTIALFCFPDLDDWEPTEEYSRNVRLKRETFSFVLTSETGSRQYGYCRRLLVPGFRARLPEVVCVVSPVGAFTFYHELILAMEKKREVSLEAAEEFLQSAYGRPLPKPGSEVSIHSWTPEFEKENLVLRRSTDFRSENLPFDVLLNHLSVNKMLAVYSSLLLERRIVLVASQPSILSSCVHALVSLLYPFTWQHTLIPVLPVSMIDIVSSPTPFVIGVLSQHVHRISDLPLDELLVVDLTKKSFLRSIGDEARIIPNKLQSALYMALKSEPSSNESMKIVIMEAFLRFFIETVGHYTDFIYLDSNDKALFNREEFVKAVHSTSIQMFLEWFTMTHMFDVYISEKLDSGFPIYTASVGEFEQRVYDYRHEMQDEVHSKKYFKSFHRKVMKKIIDSGDKLKKVFRSKNVFV